MKANELRIGNYIKVKGKVDIVNGILDNDYYTHIYGHGVFNSDIEPIPLTEEWLIRFGFEIYKNGDCVLELDDIKFTWVKEYSEFITITFCGEDKFISKSYKVNLHQLQNLYFALTGNELLITN